MKIYCALCHGEGTERNKTCPNCGCKWNWIWQLDSADKDGHRKVWLGPVPVESKISYSKPCKPAKRPEWLRAVIQGGRT